MSIQHVTRKFPKEFLKRMVIQDIDPSEGEWIDDELIDTSRWSTIHQLTFRAPDGKVFQSIYSRGKTESQDERPYDDEGDEVECTEVEGQTVVSVVWTPVVKLNS